MATATLSRDEIRRIARQYIGRVCPAVDFYSHRLRNEDEYERACEQAIQEALRLAGKAAAHG